MVFSLTRDGGTWLATIVIARHLRKDLRTGVAVRSAVARVLSPRFCLPVVTSGDGASTETVFFGDVGRDLVGKPADVLVAENCSFISTVPAEIGALTSRSYVVDLSVSRYSFRGQDIRFQVVKFYPEGSSVFVGLGGSLMAAGEAPETVDRSAGSSGVQETGAGSGDIGGQTTLAASSVDAGLHTPPPPVPLETPFEKSSVDTDQAEDLGDADLEEPVGNLTEKRHVLCLPLFLLAGYYIMSVA